MPTRVTYDTQGRKSVEVFKYTPEEVAEQETRRQAAEAEREARAAERQARQQDLADLRPNENSMPALKAKVNFLLEEVRLLRGL